MKCKIGGREFPLKLALENAMIYNSHSRVELNIKCNVVIENYKVSENI
jgi:hypothetical protein